MFERVLNTPPCQKSCPSAKFGKRPVNSSFENNHHPVLINLNEKMTVVNITLCL